MGPGIWPLTYGDQERGRDKSSTGTRRFKCRESGVSGSFSGLSGYAPGALKTLRMLVAAKSGQHATCKMAVRR